MRPADVPELQVTLDEMVEVGILTIVGEDPREGPKYLTTALGTRWLDAGSPWPVPDSLREPPS